MLTYVSMIKRGEVVCINCLVKIRKEDLLPQLLKPPRVIDYEIVQILDCRCQRFCTYGTCTVYVCIYNSRCSELGISNVYSTLPCKFVAFC